MRPRNRWLYQEDGDIVSLSFILLLAVAKNHPFEQGNKRTGLMAAIDMLRVNGYIFDAPDDEDLYEVIMDAIGGKIAEDVFIDWMRPYIFEA